MYMREKTGRRFVGRCKLFVSFVRISTDSIKSNGSLGTLCASLVRAFHDKLRNTSNKKEGKQKARKEKA